MLPECVLRLATHLWDSLPAADVNWVNVAENLWLGPKLGKQMADVSNRVFLGSPRHPTSILEPVLTYVGIGMVPSPWPTGYTWRRCLFGYLDG